MKNPYENPLNDKTGNLQELPDALTPTELQLYIAHYRWRQVNEQFPKNPRNPYQSASYFRYRTDQRIHEAKKLISDKQI